MKAIELLDSAPVVHIPAESNDECPACRWEGERDRFIRGLGEQTPSAWRTIDSAPKDGRPILIFDPERAEHPNDGFCDDARYAIGYWRTHPLWSGSWGDRNHSDVNPTHWMPLPDPPVGPPAAEPCEKVEK